MGTRLDWALRAMSPVAITYAFAHSAAWDAGVQSMRAAGRDRWNDTDWNAAAAALANLYGKPTGEGPCSADHAQEKER